MKKFVYIFALLAIPLSLNAYTFTRTLGTGSSGEDVRELQKYLNTSPVTQIAQEGAGSPGNESTYFGEKTKLAVVRLQNFFSDIILEPLGLTIGTGYVGKGTIDFINSNQEPISSPTDPQTAENVPVVESVTPERFAGNATVTITGRNFSPDNNTIIVGFESRNQFKNVKSSANGTKIEIQLDSKIQKVFEQNYGDISARAKKAVLEEFTDVPIAVSVITDAGQSNFKIINFTLK